ncbi:sirohydrochlorin ferrochelatase [Microbacterium ginsengiterrae]|uniref:Sirohydrochlorin ferrochelatase n=1 Tax=Microbacterium ginsengiterrae TaxID=546115 RepID=A0A7W9FCG4_9MICO|nr:CbiX/SirB N-terminal domain-containing protein [Microbacterium ginsengiterrae]MBB5744162.1 sirohydrochlorin ferrochelatase [Microbacterium ginsengiterrae]
MTALVACSHGTSDVAGRAAISSVIDDVRTLLPDVRVVSAVVDVEQPQIDEVLAREAVDDVVVVPVLLSVGYHTSVDISEAVGAHPRARQADPLGTHPLIADILVDRLAAALPDGWRDGDHVVLAAAGSSNPAAAQDVDLVAERLRTRVPAPVTVGFASASTPRVADAVAAARSAGARRVIAASHLLAPGFFAGLIRSAGPDVVTAPLAPDPRIARIITDRFRAMPR